MVAAIKAIANKYNNVEIICSVHLSPNVRSIANKELSDISNIRLIEPLDYPSLIWLMEKSYFVLTDSGGIQEETPTLDKPVLVMREVTERQEGVEAGTAKLVGTNKEVILNSHSLEGGNPLNGRAEPFQSRNDNKKELLNE